jgi:hypothetical protein
MPEEDLDAVIGVDTNRDTHTAPLVDTVGRQLAVLVITSNAAGYARLLAWVTKHVPGGRMLWAIEGTCSHGAGLCRALAAIGAQITEVDRPTWRASACATSRGGGASATGSTGGKPSRWTSRRCTSSSSLRLSSTA